MMLHDVFWVHKKVFLALMTDLATVCIAAFSFCAVTSYEEKGLLAAAPTLFF